MPEFFTIDDKHSHDLDDALAVEVRDGVTHIYVAITAVGQHVKIGGPADLEAQERLVTDYFSTGHRPMLDARIEERRSLLPGPVAHTCFALDIMFRGSKLEGYVPTVLKVRSRFKLAYEEIPGILADTAHPLHQQMHTLQQLSLCLLEGRRRTGALVLYDLNEGWYTNEEGHILRLERAEATVGHIIVQEMMILMNRLLAGHAVTNNLPLLYRNHTARPAAPDRQVLLQQLDDARHDPDSVEVVRRRIHLVLDKATYGAQVEGHYGLALPAYTHCTSPLRRYADLVNQRQFLALVRGEQPPYTQEQLMALAPSITEKMRAHQEERSAQMKRNAELRAERRSEAEPEYLANLPPKEFERFIKVIVHTDERNPTNLDEAVRLRIEQGTMALLDCYFLLFRSRQGYPAWQMLRQRVCRWLEDNPHQAISLLALGTNLDAWQPLSFEQRDEGEAHLKVFFARCILPHKAVTTTSEVPGRSLKEAKQRAAVTMVCLLADVPPPVWKAPVKKAPEPPVAVAPAKKPAVLNEMNPVGSLQEWSQRKGHPLPEYSFTAEGSPAVFTATVKVAGRSFTGQPAGTKQAAKASAATQAWGPCTS